jgi:hypothetical protein
MTYTINGKQYTESDINERCAELMKVTVLIVRRDYKPYSNPADTWPIIDKCWDELMKLTETFKDGFADGLCTRWEYLMDYDKCTKLVAACICLIELNE